MTPQEKAEELVLKYLRLQEPNYNWFHTGLAKQCAKIAVNEIIASIPTQPSTGELERVDAIMFWVNVGQEIDKL